MVIKVRDVNINILNMRARMPFRFGIATMTALPHLFVQAEVEIDGYLYRGIASDGLVPKWFTKNQNTTYEEDINDMFTVINSACNFAKEVGNSPNVFELWQEIYIKQKQWANENAFPPLLWGFGVSLIERALIEAFCRAKGLSFYAALQKNAFGIKLDSLYPELSSVNPANLLPPKPLESFYLRHTVGLVDPLTDNEIPENERIEDGLPQSLEACIKQYGLTHFKLKICGDADRDIERLAQIEQIISKKAPSNYVFTLDGNEQYRKITDFKKFWMALNSEPKLQNFLKHLLFVEQPLHRDNSLNLETKRELNNWENRPPIIIDESDSEIGSIIEALDSGYAGTSHKNCKGIFKGIANACLLEFRRRQNSNKTYILSGEDLTNVGPVALIQDLAVMANLGIEHIERNGHHYFKGLSMFPENT